MKNSFAILLLTIPLTACSVETGRSNTTQENLITRFIPNNYVLAEKVEGDLNGDKIKDYILIIKATKNSAIVRSDSGKAIDRNRRGIVIALSGNGKHQVTLENADCFASENEDGGVYYAPELFIETKNGNLRINFLHGRYGFWSYTFRLQNSDFELIGFDSSENRGPVVLRTTSINFSTKKMQIKENTNQKSEEEGDEKFKTTWKNLPPMKMVKLSKISDFEMLDAEYLIRPTK